MTDCSHVGERKIAEVTGYKIFWCPNCGALYDYEIQDDDSFEGSWRLPNGARVQNSDQKGKLEQRVDMLVSDLGRWEKTMRELSKQVCHHVTPADATNAAAGAAAAALGEVAELRQVVLSTESAVDKYDKQNKAIRKRLLLLEKVMAR